MARHRFPSREESNLRQWIQSPLCYHYTTRRAQGSYFKEDLVLIKQRSNPVRTN